MSNEEELSKKIVNLVRDLAKWQTGMDGVHNPSGKVILSNSKSLTFISLGLKNKKLKNLSQCIQSVALLAVEIETENYDIDNDQVESHFLDIFHNYRDMKYSMVSELSNIFDDKNLCMFVKLSITQYMMIVSECESNFNLYEDSEYDSNTTILKYYASLIRDDFGLSSAKKISSNFDTARKSLKSLRRYDSITSKAVYVNEIKIRKIAIELLIKSIISYGLSDSNQ